MKSLAIAFLVTLVANPALAQDNHVSEPTGLGFVAGAFVAYLAARALRK
jgi:hypothetical protein